MRKNKVLLITIIVLFGLMIYGEKETIQLKKQLLISEEIYKSVILNKIAQKYYKNKKFGLSFEYANKALEYAKKFKQNEQEIVAKLNIGSFYMITKKNKLAEDTLKKALILAEKTKNIKSLILVLEKYFIFYEYYNVNMNSSLLICKRLENIYKKNKNYKKQVSYTHTISSMYAIKGEIRESIEYTKKAILLYRKIGNMSKVVQLLNYLANRNQKLGDNKKALFYLNKAEKEVKEIKNLAYIHIRVKLNYMIFYKKIKNYKKAMEYLEKCIKLVKKLGNGFKFSEMGFYIQKADILIEQGNYKLANIYLEKTVGFKRTDKNWLKKDYIMEYNYSKCLIELKKRNFKKAIKMFSDVLPFVIKEDGEQGVAGIYKYYGEAYMGLRDFNKAEEYLKKGLRIYKKHKNVFLIKDIYLLMLELYKKKGDKKNPKKYLQLIKGLNIR